MLLCALIFYFETLRKLRCGLKSLKIVALKLRCAFIIFFRLVAQIYKLNLVLFHFDRNIDECRPLLASCLFFFCLKPQKRGTCIVLRNFNCGNLGCALACYKIFFPNCGVALLFNWIKIKVLSGSSAALKTLKKIKLRILCRTFTGWKDCFTLTIK